MEASSQESEIKGDVGATSAVNVEESNVDKSGDAKCGGNVPDEGVKNVRASTDESDAKAVEKSVVDDVKPCAVDNSANNVIEKNKVVTAGHGDVEMTEVDSDKTIADFDKIGVGNVDASGDVGQNVLESSNVTDSSETDMADMTTLLCEKSTLDQNETPPVGSSDSTNGRSSGATANSSQTTFKEEPDLAVLDGKERTGAGTSRDKNNIKMGPGSEAPNGTSTDIKDEIVAVVVAEDAEVSQDKGVVKVDEKGDTMQVKREELNDVARTGDVGIGRKEINDTTHLSISSVSSSDTVDTDKKSTVVVARKSQPVLQKSDSSNSQEMEKKDLEPNNVKKEPMVKKLNVSKTEQTWEKIGSKPTVKSSIRSETKASGDQGKKNEKAEAKNERQTTTFANTGKIKAEPRSSKEYSKEHCDTVKSGSGSLFDGWMVYISGTVSDETRSSLLSQGASIKSYLGAMTTHLLVGSDPDELEVADASEVHELPTLTEKFVSHALKLGRLPPLQPYSADTKPLLFHKCIVCLTKITHHDRESLWAMVRFHGGKVSLELNSRVTHLVAGKNDGAMVEKATKLNNVIHVVTPEWVLESVKSKRLVDEVNYHPKLIISAFVDPAKKRKKKVKNENQDTSKSNDSKSMSKLQLPQLPLGVNKSAPSAGLPGTDGKTSTGQQNNIPPSSSHSDQAATMPSQVQQQQISGPGHTHLSPQQSQAMSVQSRLSSTKIGLHNTDSGSSIPSGMQNQQQWQSWNAQEVQHRMQQGPSQVQHAPQQQPHLPSQPQPHLPQHQQSSQPQQLMPAQSQSQSIVSQQSPQHVHHQGQWPASGVQMQHQQTLIGAPQRQPPPHLIRQQQLIQNHLASLSLENRNAFNQLNTREKQQYLAQRGLLPAENQQQQKLPQQHQQQMSQIPQQQQLQPQEPQQQLQQSQPQQQPQHQPQQQQSPQTLQQQAHQPQQQQLQQQQPPQHQSQLQQPPRMPGQLVQQQQRVILTDQQREMFQTMNYSQQQAFLQKIQKEQQMQQMQQQQMPGWANQNQTMQTRGPRPTWTGESHPALAQVPRTPQQLQHLQRLQIQREQQQMDGNMMQQQQQPPMSQAMAPPMISAAQQPQQQPYVLDSQQKTKAALANMINSRIQHPMTSSPMVMDQNRMPMMNQQAQHILQPQQHYQQRPFVMQQQPPMNMMQHNQPRFTEHSNMMNIQQPQRGMIPASLAQQQPHVHPQRIAFVAHDPQTRLFPELCLLGCVFLVLEYDQDPEMSKFCPSIRQMIREFGGELEDEYSARVTHILCKSQDNAITQQAIHEGKRLVTVFWLNDTISFKKVRPPTRPLHFPLPPKYEAPCGGMIVTATGFSGKERESVKDMVKLIGAKYKSYLARDKNDAVIAKDLTGDKCRMAKLWDTPVVNVQWLTDVIFANVNAKQSLHNPKYHKFGLEDPFKMDYSLVPHLMAGWKNYIRVTPEIYHKFKANPPPRIKRKAERQRREKEREAKRLKEQEEQNNENNNATVKSQGTAESSEVQKSQVLSSNGEKIASAQSTNAADTGVTGQALSKNEPQKSQMKLLLQGPQAKACDIRVLFSGFVQSVLVDLTAKVVSLGGAVVQQEEANKATHLVMPKLGRTISFLCALPFVKAIVGQKWIEESAEKGNFTDAGPYRLEDPAFEKQFGFCLEPMLSKPNKTKLFAGKTFYLTPSLRPLPRSLRLVIEFSGGRVDSDRLWPMSKMKKANPRHGEPQYLIITCENDIHLVQEVLVERINVYTAEFVLGAVIKGKMDFDVSKYIVPV